MAGDPLGDYLPTLGRFILVGIVLFLVMVGTFYLCRNVFKWRREAAVGFSLIMPWLVGFLIFQVFPILATLYLSFTNYNLQQAPEWVGLGNYDMLLTQDISFWPSLKLTVLFSVIAVPIGVISSLLLAILLNMRVRLLGFYRAVYYLPSIVPVVAVALLWRWIFNPDVGLLNVALKPFFKLTGQDPPDWFGDANWVLPAFIIMSLWGIAGNNMIIFLGGLKNVPGDLYEAAELDGARAFARFRHITLPLMTPVIFFQLVAGFVGAMQLFAIAAFARATPSAGEFMNLLIYEFGFGQSRMGYASAMAIILFAILLAATMLMFRYQSRWVYYEGQHE
jgi:multiple sugar transport system permease protein